ncbi:MAG: hypothetical protein ACE5SW_11530 [Nitrososphaeraceae archaeon]
MDIFTSNKDLSGNISASFVWISIRGLPKSILQLPSLFCFVKISSFSLSSTWMRSFGLVILNLYVSPFGIV